jgi:hypothetical protein
VPDRYLADPAHPLSAADWEELEIPVGLAFFLRSSRQATVTGFYPSPAGATECQLDLAAWDRLTATHPLLGAAEIPLLLLFSGSVFATTDGRLAVQQVPWSKEAPYRLPLSTWREAIDAHFPDSAWIKMSTATLDDLLRFKTSRALPTWDATLSALLKLAGS